MFERIACACALGAARAHRPPRLVTSGFDLPPVPLSARWPRRGRDLEDQPTAAAARKASVKEGMWQLAGYSPQEQTQLAECWWRNELAIARALRPDPQ